MAHILPNEIIFRIIREADGGRYTHEDKFLDCLGVIEDIGEEYEMMEDGPHSDQSFCGLYHNKELIKSVVMYRRNK
tara:strand:+ start:152 stop:379 length:228 start_codon:yes stop_codon:yes gene_type:complete